MELSSRTASLPSDATAARPLLLRVLLTLFAWTTVVFWLPTVRSPFDGASYEWNLFGFGGVGLSGDYWFVAAASAAALAVMWVGWRGSRRVAAWLLLGWFGFLALGSLYLAVTVPEDFRFRGDTLGVDFSLAWVAPVLFGAAATGAVRLLFEERRRTPSPAAGWTRRNRLMLAGLVALLPMQFALLRFGQSEGGIADPAGVVLTIVQWLLVGRALRAG